MNRELQATLIYIYIFKKKYIKRGLRVKHEGRELRQLPQTHFVCLLIFFPPLSYFFLSCVQGRLSGVTGTFVKKKMTVITRMGGDWSINTANNTSRLHLPVRRKNTGLFGVSSAPQRREEVGSEAFFYNKDLYCSLVDIWCNGRILFCFVFVLPSNEHGRCLVFCF